MRREWMLRSLWCRMNGGHHLVRHAEPTRLSLRCLSCPHETPGWVIGTTDDLPPREQHNWWAWLRTALVPAQEPK